MCAKATIKFARRRKGVTDYEKRFNMLKSGKPRLVVRQTNKKIIAQVVSFAEPGDKVLATAISTDLALLGWKHSVKSVPAAYLTGMLVGSRAKGNSVNDCILDVGLKTLTKGSRIFAVLRGALDGGLSIPHSPENFPSDDRIQGKHISTHRKVDVSKDFADLKSKISSGAANARQPKKKAPAKK